MSKLKKHWAEHLESKPKTGNMTEEEKRKIDAASKNLLLGKRDAAAKELQSMSKQSSPIGDVEQAAKWKELVEDSKVSYAYLFAGSKLTIEDWHKIYDNAFFLFTEWLAGSQWPRPNCEANHLDINELLAEFNRRGFNTENWDGDEGAEKAIVDGVCNYLEERQEKLFDQITEQHIEINKLKNQQKQ